MDNLLPYQQYYESLEIFADIYGLILLCLAFAGIGWMFGSTCVLILYICVR